MSTLSSKKATLSIKAKTLATLCTVISAVVLPQICHLFGLVSGTGTALGETLLPMHLPILLAGFFAGPAVGAVAGLLSPLVSFALTGMPLATMLPFMMIELCVYGLAAGFVSSKKLPNTVKVLAAQISGRAVRAVAIIAGFYLFGSTVNPSVIYTSISTGIIGITLQLIIIPLCLTAYKNKNND